MQFDMVKSGWSNVLIEGIQVKISKKIIYLMINFVLANSVDPDEMVPYAAFYLGLLCLL